MLGKLIKYDFRALARNMFPLYGLMIALTLICSLMIRFNLDRGFVFGISVFAWIVSMSSSFAVTVILVVLRFYNGLLKNEGYLSFALPVKTETHILAKVINALIWAVMEALALGICVLIYAFTVANLLDVMEAFRYLFTLDADFYLSLFQMMLLGTLELVCSICLFFAALSAGHLFDRHQKLAAGIFVVAMYILRVFLFPSSFVFEYDGHMSFLHPLLFVIPLLLSGIYSLVTWFILDRHLNLQ
ncbi:MAG: hypothetical protein IIZ28_08205 [Erysipelotrichaceae bacterium]|nr:hypothetical protein [Erysipelotrichaceae bacterium]